MRIIIDMEIESDDYGGPEFKEEIEKLLADIDSPPSTRLTRFKMRSKFNDDPQDGIVRPIDWEEENYTSHD
ncbi:MAG: hypothetical protein WC714_28775 [Candidatus Obscuribacterales bacterium]|jgi:hypothetical protein